MQLKEISEYKIYTKCEQEIREWIETNFTGLSIDFYPHIEIVQTNKFTEYSKEQAGKIVESVNDKIAEILERHAEELYLASLVERVLKNHPRYNIELKEITDLKREKKFLEYVKELHIKES